MEVFAKRIIKWYKENRRDLPWRNTKEPYFIWLSEIILQQTRVEQGIDYYYRFIEAFPSITELAEAEEEQVLKLWQGLGYYSRARNLHTTAKNIVENYKGVFPKEHSKILALKGVGQYTAAAIASFSFGQNYPVVDGNVFRVLSRVFEIKTPIDSTSGNKEFYALAGLLMQNVEPDTFNQSIMEFGALQCKPKAPACNKCTLSDICLAYEKNLINELPVKSKSIKKRDRYFNYFIVEHNGALLLKKREEKDIWQSLYDFPLLETDILVDETEVLESKEWRNSFGKQEYIINSVSKIVKHVLSHQQIHARFWEISTNGPLPRNTKLFKESIIIKKHELKKYPIPRLLEKYLISKVKRDKV